MKKINIIETTLRDGSYAINFSFTLADTSIICKQLEDVGFRYIEIGQGVGLNAASGGMEQPPQFASESIGCSANQNISDRILLGWRTL